MDILCSDPDDIHANCRFRDEHSAMIGIQPDIEQAFMRRQVQHIQEHEMPLAAIDGERCMGRILRAVGHPVIIGIERPGITVIGITPEQIMLPRDPVRGIGINAQFEGKIGQFALSERCD